MASLFTVEPPVAISWDRDPGADRGARHVSGTLKNHSGSNVSGLASDLPGPNGEKCFGCGHEMRCDAGGAEVLKQCDASVAFNPSSGQIVGRSPETRSSAWGATTPPPTRAIADDSPRPCPGGRWTHPFGWCPTGGNVISMESGAVEKTRTSTAFRPQRPQRCASTSSATTARETPSDGADGW